ncbi:hypothetical protein CTAYLR_009873 [Chrysophaeum taylorii]|uniref:Dynein regulatory complex subunit 3 n=1 Tax=Chrysophaeum taylorii TaxID=2483200 RepID=A0AAD7U5P7_9STRA|nr:hypothetical protein CTAYLR_009873 [Chrysophaeum taylorii]
MSIDNDEIQVIDDELIFAALRESDGTPGAKEASGGVDLGQANLADMVLDAPELRLSFKNILKLDNLQGFHALMKLCLDNNVIEEIRNLDHLIHLRWLDLSFNNISKITGLEKLIQLTDLSLFNNQISEVDGLESCKELQCLSLGNNNITALTESINKLRCFKKLQLLNLEGNPVSKESEYRMYVLAYLKYLTYLDYSMVMKSESDAAKEQYHTELLDVEDKEAFEEEKLARELAAANHTAELRAANLVFVETIFEDMFADDAENAKLRHLPGITEIYNAFQSEVESASDTFMQTGLAKHKQKQDEVKTFEETLLAGRVKGTEESIAKIEDFCRKKKHTLRDLSVRQNIEASDLDPLRASLDELYNSCMDIEMKQIEQFENLANQFENKYLEFKQACLEGQQGYFRQLEEHENNYTRDLMQLVNELLDKAAKDELTAELNDEAALLLADRDTCMNTVTGSHDIHVGRLFKVEDEAKNNEEVNCKSKIKTYRNEEHTRNRNRVLELTTFKESVLVELAELITREADVDVDGDPE